MINTGLQDAYNLGWKLALAVHGAAHPALLDSYQTERYPIAKGVLRRTDLPTRVMTLRNPVGAGQHARHRTGVNAITTRGEKT